MVHWIIWWEVSFFPMPCMVSESRWTIRRMLETANFTLCCPGASHNLGLWSVAFNHLVEPVKLHPVQSTSVTKAKGFGDGRVSHRNVEPFANRVCGMLLFNRPVCSCDPKRDRHTPNSHRGRFNDKEVILSPVFAHKRNTAHCERLLRTK